MRNLPRHPCGVREQEGQLARLGWLHPVSVTFCMMVGNRIHMVDGGGIRTYSVHVDNRGRSPSGAGSSWVSWMCCYRRSARRT